MNVQILDCTIRDGGYLLNKNTDLNFVKNVVSGLVESGIDLIENSFLQNTVNDETIVFHNSNEVKSIIPENKGKSCFVGFCDSSSYNTENLDFCDGNSFSNFRIAFSKYDMENAIQYGKLAIEKGYKVFIQPKDTPSYSFDEIGELIEKVNAISPEAFSIVDTFGVMYLEDLEKMFTFIDSKLNKKIKIGLHSHNNLQMSNALAIKMIELAEKVGRDIVVDCSLFGMGKGAGNTNTEVVADYINKRYGQRYNMNAILNTIENYLIPMKKEVNWGYSIPMFICGTESADVSNITYLTKTFNSSYANMYNAISNLTYDVRKHYVDGGVKVDFTKLDESYKALKK